MRLPGVLAALMGLSSCGGDAFSSAPTDDASTDTSPANDSSLPVDGAPPGDGATKDGSIIGVDAAPPVFDCSPAPVGTILCTKFEGSKADVGWTGDIAFGGGAIALDSTTYVSPLHSFLATITPPDSGGGAASASLLIQDFNGLTYKTLSGRAMLRVHSVGERIPVLRLNYPAGGGQDGAEIQTDGKNLFLDVLLQGVPTSLVSVVPIGLDTWTEVRLDLTPPPSTVDVSMYVGGMLVKSLSPALGAPSSGQRECSLGVVTATGTADTVNFDDFLLRGVN